MEMWEIETAKRSAAIAPLSKHEVDRILDELHRLTRERQQMTTILGGLPATFHEVRKALNELQSWPKTDDAGLREAPMSHNLAGVGHGRVRSRTSVRPRDRQLHVATV